MRLQISKVYSSLCQSSTFYLLDPFFLVFLSLIKKKLVLIKKNCVTKRDEQRKKNKNLNILKGCSNPRRWKEEKILMDDKV